MHQYSFTPNTDRVLNLLPESVINLHFQQSTINSYIP